MEKKTYEERGLLVYQIDHTAKRNSSKCSWSEPSRLKQVAKDDETFNLIAFLISWFNTFAQ